MRSTTAPSPGLRSGIFALAAAMAVTTGCAYLRETIGLGPVRPKVSLAAIEVTKVTLSAVELVASLRVDNPNDFALTFRNLVYRLDAGGLELAAGNFKESLKVPAEGQVVVRLPVAVNATNAVKLARKLLNSQGEMLAEMTATADFVTPFGDMEVSFEEKRPLAKLAGF